MECIGIAEVAARYKISARALRYYEEIGILSSHRAAETGYRSYDRAQCERLEVILLLRRLSFSIKEIAQLLGGDNDFLFSLLEKKRIRSLKNQLEAQETSRLLGDLTQALQSTPLTEIKVDELLKNYTYLTQKTERMINMNEKERYIISVGYELIPMAVPPEEILIKKIQQLRDSLENEGASLSPVRIIDNKLLEKNEAAILFDEVEFWRKALPEGASHDAFGDEIMAQIRRHVKK